MSISDMKCVEGMSKAELKDAYTKQLDSKITRCQITSRHCHLWYQVPGAGWCLHSKKQPKSWHCPEWDEKNEHSRL